MVDESRDSSFAERQSSRESGKEPVHKIRPSVDHLFRRLADDCIHTPASPNTRDTSTQTGGEELAKELVDLQPPAPVLLHRSVSYTFRLPYMGFRKITREKFCVRSRTIHFYEFRAPEARYRQSQESQLAFSDEDHYIVIGVMGVNENIPHEVVLPGKVGHGDLFKQIRKGMRQLRPLYKRVFSLKQVSGFTLYECIPSQGYHRLPELSNSTKRTMAEFWKDFQTLDSDFRDRWLNWVHVNFNNSSNDVSNGTYSLQMVLRWSPKRLFSWGALPILLSLALGFGYMFKPNPGEDFFTVIQTAWAIASYIITASSLGLAVAAAITQISDK